MENTMAFIERAQNGDKKAREQIVEENTGLVWSVARRFMGRGVELEDLFQIGSIGLMKAVDKFDMSFGVKFSTYAVPMITGEIKRFLRDDGMVKVSRALKELAIKAYHVKEQLYSRTGQEPTVKEIAEILSVEEEELVQALDTCVEVESLQKVVYQGERQEVCLMDKIEEERDAHEELLNSILLKELLSGLGSKERELIYLRYFQDQTQMQIAKKMGISQVQVSRLEKKILHKMREQGTY